MTEAPSARPDTSDMHAVHQVFRSSLASAPQFIGSAERDDGRRALIANYYANLMASSRCTTKGRRRSSSPS
jgi:hypothetical protein